jgi:hypothetical protein
MASTYGRRRQDRPRPVHLKGSRRYSSACGVETVGVAADARSVSGKQLVTCRRCLRIIAKQALTPA